MNVAVMTIALNTDDVLQEFNLSSKLLADQQSAINDPRMVEAGNIAVFVSNVVEIIMDQVSPIMMTFMDKLTNLTSDHIDFIQDMNRVKYGIFILLCFIVFGFLWVPYMKKLNRKIIRTKGMLNMIPLEFILHNENLKNAFLHGGIIKAIR